MLDIVMMLGAAFIVVEGLMVLFWFSYLLSKNLSIVNLSWGLSFILATLIYALLGEGYEWRKLLVLTIVSIWALRLTYYQAKFSQENSLVAEPSWILSSLFKNIQNENFRILLFFIIQGILVIILSLPFALMSHNRLTFFLPVEVFSLLIWMGGFMGETMIDWQFVRFKQTENGENQANDQGIRKYLRGFFEWIVWVGYAMMALASPWGWAAFISPLLRLFLPFTRSRKTLL